MTDAAIVESTYVSDFGKLCPFCGATGPERRLGPVSHITSTAPDRLPRMYIGCRCLACGGRWDEYYTMSGICWEGKYS